MIYYCLMFLLVTVSHSRANDIKSQCVARGHTLNCVGRIPKVLPVNTTGVFIDVFKGDNLDGEFLDKSWSRVQFLRIYVTDDEIFWLLKNRTFSTLTELLSLTFRGNSLAILEEYAFAGLKYLKVLDLSGCTSLKADEIIRSLKSPDVLPNLNELVLQKSASVNGWYFSFGPELAHLLTIRKISKLNLSQTNLFFHGFGLSVESPLLVTHLNLSQSNYFLEQIFYIINLAFLFKNVKVFDASGMEYRQPGIQDFTNQNCDGILFPFIVRLKTAYVNNMMIPWTKWNVMLNASNCDVNLQLLQMRFCRISIFNITTLWPSEAPQLKIDLMGNSIRYFKMTGNIPVHQLNLASNRLNLMADDPEFKDSFQAISLLEEVDISENELSFLPKDIFSKNPHLKKIQLFGNHLSTISFDMSKLISLLFLNLGNNLFKVIGQESILQIENLQNLQQHKNQSTESTDKLECVPFA